MLHEQFASSCPQSRLNLTNLLTVFRSLFPRGAGVVNLVIVPCASCNEDMSIDIFLRGFHDKIPIMLQTGLEGNSSMAI